MSGTLIAFPAEVRKMIYEHVLDFDSHPKYYWGHDKELLKQYKNSSSRFKRLEMLRVSKFVYDEAFPVLFTSNALCLQIDTRQNSVIDDYENEPEHFLWECGGGHWDGGYTNHAFLLVSIGRHSHYCLPRRLRKWFPFFRRWALDLDP